MVAMTDNIIDRLADLSPEQLREINARSSFLLNPSGSEDGEKEDKDHDLEMVGKEFAGILSANGDKRAIPIPILLKTRAGKPFRKGSKLLLSFIREEFDTKQKVEVIKVVRTLLRLMAKDLQSMGRPISPMTLARQMEMVGQVVDRHFPGYRANGMLPIIKALAIDTRRGD